MAIGEKFTQLPDEITSPDGTEIFAVSALISGTWKSARLLVSNLSTYILGQIDSWTSATYAASSDNWIDLGDETVYRAVRVSYVVERTSKYQTGQFEVIHNDSTAKVSVTGKVSHASAPDIEIKAARLNGGQIQVNIKTGSDDANSTYFKYKIIDQKPVT